jgi:probable rRNA maturation factor
MLLDNQKKVDLLLRPLEKFFHKALREFKLRPDAVAIAFVTDAKITRLNKTYRGKNRPTDVLSFPAAIPRKRGKKTEFLGDIAIAPETARRYAKKNGRTLESEMCVLILHGLLHLLGYDHETDRGQMDRIEHNLRRKLGIEA